VGEVMRHYVRKAPENALCDAPRILAHRLVRTCQMRPGARIAHWQNVIASLNQRDLMSNENPLLDAASNELTGWSDPLRRLRDALERDELRLFFQPIAAMSGSEPYLMAEILVRLIEEENLQLPPGEFLPVFEHYGMMPELDRWVVRNSLAALAASRTSGFRRLSINVSAQSLHDRSMHQYVAGRLDQVGLPARVLCFEVDENDVLTTPQVAARFATELRRLGCQIAIDGFGYRARSFAPLKTLHVDYLKIDGSITRNLLRSDGAVRKVQAIVRVCDAIGCGVIAECVEDVEVLERLRALGVGFAQGFGIARPGPLE
jgi:ammonium transporter, Amt family